MEHPIKILEHYWNFTSFKPLQEEIINSVIEGNDTFALLPTGGGKSLCFQIPALAKEGICIVISPLIALMNNQVAALKEKNIKAIALTSSYKYDELSTLLDNCIYGNYKFLYISPERLQQEIVHDRIRQMNVNLIAVDEAHCISQWGNDFRPAYKQIKLLRELQPSVNCVALTASAKPEVVEDAIKELDFIDSKVFKQSFYRSNLAYMVYETEDKLYKIKQILKKNPSSSIIYVRNRKSTLDISKALNSNGFKCTFYHGGLSPQEKEKNFSSWLNNRSQAIVATNAFGMGIDKPDVKTVIHTDLPDSLESYFQEAGRAGRNGNKAFAVILKNKNDEERVKNQFLSVLPNVDFIKQVYRKLCNYFQISYGEGAYTTHNFNFNKFCKTYNFNTILTYNAILVLDRNSIIILTQQFKRRSTVQIIVANSGLFSYIENNQEISVIIKSILRTYGGIFDQDVKINTLLIADKANVSEDTVINTLIKLEKDKIITLNLNKTDAEITFIEPREDDKTINRIANTIEVQNKQKVKQVNDVISYITNETVCKSQQLLNYFGESITTNCGICSVCINKASSSKSNSQINGIEIVISLLQKESLSSRDLLEKSTLTETVITETLKILLEKKAIRITEYNTYILV
ncbi:MAG: RecQ family ATP-dependent DNA helicase [Bacteroidetes bacterium]|nr:MAG: RecQ family ATP-dependent DNA helicase [Bacteroidota bacterium]